MSSPLNPSQFVYALHPGDKPLNHMNDIVDDPVEAREREATINRIMAPPPVVRNYGWDPSKHWEK